MGRRYEASRTLIAATAGVFVAVASVAVASTKMSERAARESMAPTGAPVIAVGHRGAMRFAPENTIAGHEKAIEMGARAVEMDVRMTKDGEFVVMHDATVDRTTDGSGLVSQMTLSEIKKLDAGSWFSTAYAGLVDWLMPVRLPTPSRVYSQQKGVGSPSRICRQIELAVRDYID